MRLHDLHDFTKRRIKNCGLFTSKIQENNGIRKWTKVQNLITFNLLVFCSFLNDSNNILNFLNLKYKEFYIRLKISIYKLVDETNFFSRYF